MDSTILELAAIQKARKNHLLRSGLASFDPVTLALDYSYLTETEWHGDSVEHSAVKRATMIHERIHWLQFTGSTIGLLKMLTSVLQIGSMTQLLQKLPFTLPTSVYLDSILAAADEAPARLSGLPDAIASDIRHTLDLALQCDYLNALIESTDSTLISGIPAAKTLSQCFAHLAINATPQRGRTDGDRQVLFEKAYVSTWETAKEQQLIGIRLEQPGECFSAFHLFEGQARMIEMNKYFRSLVHGGMSIEAANPLIAQYIANPPYNTAYTLFKAIVAAEELQEDYLRVLFLIACDYALNPYVPPMFDTDAVYRQGIAHLLPDKRFLAICYALKKICKESFKFVDEEELIAAVQDPANSAKDFSTSPDDYNDLILFFQDKIKAETHYDTPLEVARHFLNLYTDDFRAGIVDSGFVFRLDLFKKACEVRCENQLYFIDCSLLEANDRKLYLALNSKHQYLLLKKEGKFRSGYPEDAYTDFVSDQVNTRFVLDSFNDERIDLDPFLAYAGVDKAALVSILSAYYRKVEINNFIK